MEKDKEKDVVIDEEKKESKGSNSKKKKSYKGKKNNRNASSNGKGNQGSDIPSHNDWSFYAASEQMAKDAASIPFNFIPGTSFKVSMKSQGGSEVTPVESESDFSVGSVGLIDYVPSIGISDYNTPNSAINMAAAQLYARIRKANSGAKNYEAPDVMMYVLAMRDVYSTFFEIKRIIGLANTFVAMNHNLPDSILVALGCDPADVRAQIANWRYRLNTMAAKINSFAVPKYFKCFERAAYVSSMIFADDVSVQAQHYVFKKSGYYVWNGTKYDTGTCLAYHNNGLPAMTVLNNQVNTPDAGTGLSGYFDILDTQLNALFYDEDALTMSGDIWKAFDGDLYTLTETPTDYATPIVHDEDILAQIQNARFIDTIGYSIGTPFALYDAEEAPVEYHYTVGITKANIGSQDGTGTTSFDVKQSNQLIYFKPHFEIAKTVRGLMIDRLAFNSPHDNPDYKDILEWTRLIPTLKWEKNTAVGANKDFIIITSSGLEIPLNLRFLVYRKTAGGNRLFCYPIAQIRLPSTLIVTDGDVYQDNSQSDYYGEYIFDQYDWHPCVYKIDPSFAGAADDKFSTDGTFVLSPVGFDIKRSVPLESDVAFNINACAIYGSFYHEERR